MYGLPDFVANEMPEIGAQALYKLGFKADDKYPDDNPNCSACYIIHPDGRYIEYDYGHFQQPINNLRNKLLKLNKG